MSAPQQNMGTSADIDLQTAAANLAKSRLDVALWDDAAEAALKGDAQAVLPVTLR